MVVDFAEKMKKSLLATYFPKREKHRVTYKRNWKCNLLPMSNRSFLVCYQLLCLYIVHFIATNTVSDKERVFARKWKSYVSSLLYSAFIPFVLGPFETPVSVS